MLIIVFLMFPFLITFIADDCGSVSILHFVWYRVTVFDSQHGATALIRAAQIGRTECVRLLLNAGANKEAKTGGVRLVFPVSVLSENLPTRHVT